MVFNKSKLQIFFVFIACFVSFLSSCNSDDGCKFETPPALADRTVLIYCCGNNNLASELNADYAEMLEGAKSIGNNHLIVYIKDGNQSRIDHLTKDGVETIKKFDSSISAVNPENMAEVMELTTRMFSSKSYGLCFWGHGTGVINAKDTLTYSSSARRRAYGTDNSCWINIPKIAQVVRTSMPHLDFLFWDCCCMQTIEVACEFRDVCDYMIGSPSEIPACGADYSAVVPKMFLEKESIPTGMIDAYISSYKPKSSVSGLPLSAIRTEYIDALADATNVALNSLTRNGNISLSLDSCIYYYKNNNSSDLVSPIMHDMRHVMRRNLTTDSFLSWDEAFQKAVPYSVCPVDRRESGKYYTWETDTWSINISFSSFVVSKDCYGGVSMFFPGTYLYGSKIDNPNESIYNFEWGRTIWNRNY